ncbi:MAG: hypothetical protein IKV61_06730 [Clostridia bacterium]|nr:hypothetical protein [Clostridia bacterium]
MNLTVVYPKNAHSAYEISANEFIKLYSKITQNSALKLTDQDFCALSNKPACVVLIGNDSVNNIVGKFYLEGKIAPFNFSYGTDAYVIRTVQIDGTNYLILAGARPRATLYAVYLYFEKFCNCHYFWDGDRIPQRTTIVLDGIDVCENPRFEYRGIRYFAHRSLHRFQAEHWGYEDWKNEIDWLIKSRLNLFMLRTGMDDVWQKAFPNIVPYPSLTDKAENSGYGYDDRSLFWPLEYKGELRKKILSYAFERDLIHPEDTGTMTHWYSRTPKEFIENVKPTFLSQSTHSYAEQTGLVFDVRDNKNMEYYAHLTDTHVKEYGQGQIFHTIGLAERKFSQDKEENARLKLYTYRKISENIKEKYPNAPLLIASWDLWMYYTPQEVEALLNELDKNQAILFDYTSEVQDKNNFTNWNVVGKFPWIFGIFGGLEKHHDVRGNFSLMNERLKIAKRDNMCKGMVFWPEFSHGSALYLHYLTKNAWEEEVLSVEDFINNFCSARYSESNFNVMATAWKNLMPVSKLMTWGTYDDDEVILFDDLYENIKARACFNESELERNITLLKPFNNAKNSAITVLKTLKNLSGYDSQLERDLYDIIRTIIGRYINACILKAQIAYAKKDLNEVKHASNSAIKLLKNLALLLGGHNDYSLYNSLKKLEEETTFNPNFEQTLKNNSECQYCRAHIYENAEYLYLPEVEIWLNEAVNSLCENRDFNKENALEKINENREVYFKTPLKDLEVKNLEVLKIIDNCLDILNNINLNV